MSSTHRAGGGTDFERRRDSRWAKKRRRGGSRLCAVVGDEGVAIEGRVGSGETGGRRSLFNGSDDGEESEETRERWSHVSAY